MAGSVGMGTVARRVDDPSDPEQLYGAYLCLLYAVRGARRGEELQLRAADLNALLAVVGEDPEHIERRLVQLMGCTPEDASLLRRVLLRHRALTATIGVAAGLSVLALLGPSAANATPQSEQAVPTATLTAESPHLSSYATTDDGRHVPIPASWTSVPTAAPAPAPVAQVAAMSAPAPGPEPEVMLGQPMVPIDRPAPSPSPAEADVLLGAAMVPIDRPDPATSQDEGSTPG